ncbi:hypothetical protein C8A05DRAFT_16604 [Staphylotrichum tortipilum]|uniref:F-box domain-containing protein n=1 Tax=Staphylotrichum tortipilum TaxID=2831512 RepID=A0AAN6MHW9_9PEZI|nr:hypothetical protein C8A05DRAFT_16604 [Staphylotrichum longicolle]
MVQTNLMTLPQELLLAICSELCCHCLRTPIHDRVERRARQADLLSFSKACRRLHAAAEPFRYHGPFLGRELDLAFLLRTLSARPDLAARVSEVALHSFFRLPSTIATLDETRPISASLPAILAVALSGLKPRLRDLDGWTQHVAMLLSLLELLPSPERLYLYLPGLFHLKQSFQSTKSFAGFWSTSLKTLAFGSAGCDYPLDDAVHLLRRAPNLEILRCDQLQEVSDRFSASLRRATPSDPAPLQSLTELALADMYLTAADFGNLVSPIGPRLARVTIGRTANEKFIVEFAEVVTALQPWRNTLKELSFTIDGVALPYIAGLSPARRLRKFEVLEVLETQTVCFDLDGDVGPQEEALASALPPSIRRLRLLGSGDLAPGLWGLAGALEAGRFAQLRTVEIDGQSGKGDGPESEAGRGLGDVAWGTWLPHFGRPGSVSSSILCHRLADWAL